MTILLIRHGETPLNAARVMQPPDTPLSERGIAQALALAQRLGAAPLAGILSSDLRRAHDTAQAVAARTGLPVQTTPLLHERNAYLAGAVRAAALDGVRRLVVVVGKGHMPGLLHALLYSST